jgi:hypothetical protein
MDLSLSLGVQHTNTQRITKSHARWLQWHNFIDHIHIIAFANPLIKSNIQQLRNNSLTQSDPPTTSHYYFNQDEKFF